MVSTKYKKTGKFRIQKVGIQKTSEFGKLDRETSGFRIQETGFQNRETGILKVGNWTRKLQKPQNSELGNWMLLGML